jgi:CheY-like chemotaxis protein
MNVLPKIIFILDDDPEDQEIFLEVLSEVDSSIIGLQPQTAHLAFNLMLLDGRIPDYIFVDLNMPEMNGFEFLETIKKNSALSHIPIVIYTTSTDNRDRNKAMAMGATAFLTKPNSKQALREAIERILTLTESH